MFTPRAIGDMGACHARYVCHYVISLISFLNRAIIYLTILCCGAAVRAADTSAPASADSIVTHVDSKQANKLIAEKKVVVLDIRTPEEFKAGRIGGATNINFRATDFEQRIDGLDKSKSYIVHCASGGRSTQSLATFEKLSFRSIYHLDGGFKAWEKAGLPVQK